MIERPAVQPASPPFRGFVPPSIEAALPTAATVSVSSPAGATTFQKVFHFLTGFHVDAAPDVPFGLKPSPFALWYLAPQGLGGFVPNKAAPIFEVPNESSLHTGVEGILENPVRYWRNWQGSVERELREAEEKGYNFAKQTQHTLTDQQLREAFLGDYQGVRGGLYQRDRLEAQGRQRARAEELYRRGITEVYSERYQTRVFVVVPIETKLRIDAEKRYRTPVTPTVSPELNSLLTGRGGGAPQPEPGVKVGGFIEEIATLAWLGRVAKVVGGGAYSPPSSPPPPPGPDPKFSGMPDVAHNDPSTIVNNLTREAVRQQIGTGIALIAQTADP